MTKGETQSSNSSVGGGEALTKMTPGRSWWRWGWGTRGLGWGLGSGKEQDRLRRQVATRKERVRAPVDYMGKRHSPTDILQRSRQGWCGPQAWPGEELGKGRSDQPE